MSNKRDIKMLKELSEFTNETLKELKRGWAEVPAKQKARNRRKIKTAILKYKEVQVLKASKYRGMPKAL